MIKIVNIGFDAKTITKGILGINKKFNWFCKKYRRLERKWIYLKKFAMVGALGALVAFLNSKDVSRMKRNKYMNLQIAE